MRFAVLKFRLSHYGLLSFFLHFLFCECIRNQDVFAVFDSFHITVSINCSLLNPSRQQFFYSLSSHLLHALFSSECFCLNFPFLWNLWINQYEYLISSDINNCFLQVSPIYIRMTSVKMFVLHVWRVLIWIYSTFCFLLPFQKFPYPCFY